MSRILKVLFALLIVVLLTSAALIYVNPVIRDTFGVEKFVNDYKYKWSNSDQPEIINYGSDCRKKLIKAAYADGFIKILAFSLKDAVPAGIEAVWKGSRLYKEGIRLNDKAISVGVSFDRGQSPQRIIRYLKDANVKSVIVRVPDRYSAIYRHSDHKNIRNGINALIKNGIEVVIGIPQSRDMVKEPDKWVSHIREALGIYYPACKYFIVGEAPNRVKWGVWDYAEFLKLFSLAEKEIHKYKYAKIIGPSVIDFEWFWFDGLLNYIPPSGIDIVNTLLYVDRRGPPEGKQFGFDLPKKLQALYALYKRRDASADKPLWITEVNWPLKGHGDWSPAGGGIDEDTYADYLVRYYILGLSTGVPQRIYWWQLEARGYGLLDDSHDPVRERPGWLAFKYLKKSLDNAIFLKASVKDDKYIFKFRKEKMDFYVLWAVRSATIDIPEDSKAYDKIGRSFSHSGRLNLGGSPVYVYSGHELL